MTEYKHGDIVKLKDGRTVRILEKFYKGDKIREYEIREIGTDPYNTSSERVKPSGVKRMESLP